MGYGTALQLSLPAKQLPWKNPGSYAFTQKGFKELQVHRFYTTKAESALFAEAVEVVW